MTDPRPRDNGTSRMTEFPALRDALVRAAVRRRRRRRAAAGTAVPLFAAGAAAVAALAFSPAPPPDRERTVAPPGPTSTATSTPKPYAQQSLQEAFAVFRRKPARADRLPAGVGIAGVRQLDEVRFLKQGGPKRYFAVSYATKDGESVCILQVRHKRFDSATCAPAVEAIDEATPLYTGVAGDIGVFLPDSSRDLRFLLANGTGGVSSSNNLSLVKVFTPLAGMSWTGGSGTRHIKDFGTKRGLGTPPTTCPKRQLEPLPPDALARARRKALIAVDLFYAQAATATVATAARAETTPCSAAVTERSIEVTLRLVPRDGGAPAEGRLLLGMQDGYMRVLYLLR